MKRHLALSLAAAVVVVGTLSSFEASASTSTKSNLALARKALVVFSDFPSGWTTAPYSNSGGTPGLKQIATCLHLPLSVVNYNPPVANSPYFDENALNLEVQDAVDVFPSVKIATQQFELFASADSLHCVIQVFNTPVFKVPLSQEIGEGSVIGTITARVLPKPIPNRESGALVVRVPATYKGISLTVEIEIATIMSKTRTEGAQLTFSYSTSPFPASLIRHLETVTAQRLG